MAVLSLASRPVLSLSFAERLHTVLEHPAIGCIVWRPHGRCFEIIDHEQLEQYILQPIFQMDKMEEFDAALVLHGVYRIRRGRDAGCYYHDVSSLEIWQCDVEEEEDGIYACVCCTGIASRFPLPASRLQMLYIGSYLILIVFFACLGSLQLNFFRCD